MLNSFTEELFLSFNSALTALKLRSFASPSSSNIAPSVVNMLAPTVQYSTVQYTIKQLMYN